MNFHSKEWIMKGVREHYEDGLLRFPEDKIIVCACQGSQVYGLDTEHSDIDTKLIVTPSFEEIALHKPAVSTTYVRENGEHVDFKDVRLYFDTFLKQNPNFIEVLYTDYIIVNPLYKTAWDKLIAMREEIARLNPYQAVTAMKGTAMNKRHMMTTCGTAEKNPIFDKFGYNPKELATLLLTESRLNKYVAGCSYDTCLVPDEYLAEYLLSVKAGRYPMLEALKVAGSAIDNINAAADKFRETHLDEPNQETVKKLRTIQKEIMAISLMQDLKPLE